MSQEKTINVAQALAAQLRVTEEAIDTALGEAANLVETYVSSRRAVRVAPATGGDVRENTLKAMMALNSAQAYMSAAHAGLSRVGRKMGLSPDATMPPYDKPEDDDGKPGKSGVQPSDAAALY